MWSYYHSTVKFRVDISHLTRFMLRYKVMKLCMIIAIFYIVFDYILHSFIYFSRVLDNFNKAKARLKHKIIIKWDSSDKSFDFLIMLTTIQIQTVFEIINKLVISTMVQSGGLVVFPENQNGFVTNPQW